MEIFSVNDEKFRKYGKVWNNIECTKLIKGMEHTPLPEGNAKLSCIIQVILRLPVMHTAAKHIDLLLHSTGICYIHLHRHAKHKRRNDHSGTDQHNMMFLFGPFSEVLMHLQSHLPELPSLVGRTLSWRNESLPSAPQW